MEVRIVKTCSGFQEHLLLAGALLPPDWDADDIVQMVVLLEWDRRAERNERLRQKLIQRNPVGTRLPFRVPLRFQAKL